MVLHSGDKYTFLTPKIPCVYWPNYAVFDIDGETIFSKIQSMRTVGSLSYLGVHEPQKITTLNSMEFMRV
jgi:hypothetical protein